MIKEIHKVEVPPLAGQRIGDYLVGRLSSIKSRKGIKKAIAKNRVFINEEIATSGRFVKVGDTVTVIEEETPTIPFKLKLEVVYEDEFIAVVKKPAGYPVSGNYFKTVYNALPVNLKPSTVADAYANAKPVHRLDAATSGLLLIAKTSFAHMNLSEQFEKQRIKKEYHAVVMGKIIQDITIDSPVEGKVARSDIIVVNHSRSIVNDWLTLVKVIPFTGRTHQIRKHLSGIGYPILGDKLYGKEGMILKHKGLFLASTKISFIHPETKEQLSVEMDAPNKFNRRLEQEHRRWKKYHE